RLQRFLERRTDGARRPRSRRVESAAAQFGGASLSWPRRARFRLALSACLPLRRLRAGAPALRRGVDLLAAGQPGACRHNGASGAPGQARDTHRSYLSPFRDGPRSWTEFVPDHDAAGAGPAVDRSQAALRGRALRSADLQTAIGADARAFAPVRPAL